MEQGLNKDKALLQICRSGDDSAKSLVIVCLSNGANPNTTDINRRTTMHFACKRGKAELAVALCGSEDLDINKRDFGGETALMKAVQA